MEKNLNQNSSQQNIPSQPYHKDKRAPFYIALFITLFVVLIFAGYNYLVTNQTGTIAETNGNNNTSVQGTNTKEYRYSKEIKLIEHSSTPPAEVESSLSVPSIYPELTWDSVATSSYEMLNVDGSPGRHSLYGKLYEASRTSSDSYDEIFLNSYEKSFVSYYEDTLEEIGYGRSSLLFDANLNLLNRNSNDRKYIISPINGLGSSRHVGYVKYTDGYLRVIDVSSVRSGYKVFVSDIYSLEDLTK